jgi:hypothetical protein
MNNSPNFLHDHPDFSTLVERTATTEGITAYLAEKDYWLMHTIWGLKQLGLSFQLKGGTSLSKGFGCIHRFSEDIDIKIDSTDSLCGFKVYSGKNHDKDKYRDSRKQYFTWLANYLQNRIPGIESVDRDETYDDTIKYRNGGIRLLYQSRFPHTEGTKDGILLEVGFDRTAPNQPCLITSWVYEQGSQASNQRFTDNRAPNVLCYEPKYTFVEKLQAVIRKFRLYREGKKGASLPSNFIRHYYDLYQLIERPDVQEFIGTKEYEDFKVERFGTDDTKVSKSDAFTLKTKTDRELFESEYLRSAPLYYKGRPTLQEILDRIAKDLHRL